MDASSPVPTLPLAQLLPLGMAVRRLERLCPDTALTLTLAPDHLVTLLLLLKRVELVRDWTALERATFVQLSTQVAEHCPR